MKHCNIISTDINECSRGVDSCSSLAECSNTVGSYECRCKAGYQGDGRVCTGTFVLEKPFGNVVTSTHKPEGGSHKNVIIEQVAQGSHALL